MAYLSKEWTGSEGIVFYGDVPLFVTDWAVKIETDTIDVTNISIYKGPNPLPLQQDYDGNTGPQNLPFPENLPDTDKPWKIKSDDDLARKQSQYMAGRLNIDGGLRQGTITCSGLCASYNLVDDENYIPRTGNYVYMQFQSRNNPEITLFSFPKVYIKNVSFNFDIKDYTRWVLEGITTGDFDVFPGYSN